MDCERLLDRLPAELSGGQQQRVALARGLVSHPDLVLFDEPLSNLDARLRDQVRAELHDLHQRKPFTAVFVTHDQSEALALGTRMAIMRAGRIVQIGPPREVFEEPVDEYVAGFTGMSNRVPCEYVDGRWYALGTEIHGMQPRAEASVGSFVLRLRPEKVRLVTDVADLLPGEAGMAVHIDDVEYGGLHFDVMCSVVGDGSVRRQLHARIQTFDTARMPRTVNRGATMIFAFDPLDARTFDNDGTALALPRQALTGALVG